MIKNKNEFKKNTFMPFVVLGDPNKENSKKIIKKLVENGADALELGFAFSDPVADGPVIQLANKRVLDKNNSTKNNFEIIQNIRSYSNIPISLMLSYNLALAFGLENFYKKCSELKINGLLFPDIPVEENKDINYFSKKYKINQVYLIATNSNEERIKKISKFARGYIYLVSTLGTTGMRNEIDKTIKTKIKQIKKYTNLPIYVGFGISKPTHVQNVLEMGADGAICGSSFCKIIENNLNDDYLMIKNIGVFCRKMSQSTNAKIKKNKVGDY